MKFKALTIVTSLVLSASLASCGTEVLKANNDNNPNAKYDNSKSKPVHPTGAKYLESDRYRK